jgi:hypothetical protein
VVDSSQPPIRSRLPLVAERATEFLNGASVTREDVWRILEAADASSVRAEEAVTKRLLAILAVWVAAYAIKSNTISEGSIASFKLGELSVIVLFAPLVMAILYHNVMALIASSIISGYVTFQCYRKLFPEATKEQLESITLSPNTVTLENLITTRALPASGCLRVSSGFLLIGLFSGPLLLLAHVVYLSVTTSFATWSKIVILAGALFLVARAIQLFFLPLKLSGRAA